MVIRRSALHRHAVHVLLLSAALIFFLGGQEGAFFAGSLDLRRPEANGHILEVGKSGVMVVQLVETPVGPEGDLPAFQEELHQQPRPADQPSEDSPWAEQVLSPQPAEVHQRTHPADLPPETEPEVEQALTPQPEEGYLWP